MKKTIGKPENWQDFESLCKKLWGEIWQISNTIKKNGRLGQDQSGVDIYGIPKGENNFWGIQCKGKDDYSNAKLTENEVVNEIEKAKKFQPTLKVYIIATTSNKDSKIEEFIRLISVANQEKNSFEVLLFCWEDIVDLLEDNPNTLNWYLHGINHRSRYDFKVLFNDFEENLIIKPIFEKKITKYIRKEKSQREILLDSFSNRKLDIFEFNPIFGYSNRINKSWVNFELIMENIGLTVLEDWYFTLTFKEGVDSLDDDSDGIISLIHTSVLKDAETKTITYRPRNNSPLIQKDNRYFKVLILPEIEATKIIAEWELLARDFDRKGTLEIAVEPEFIEIIEHEELSMDSALQEDAISISYYIVEK